MRLPGSSQCNVRASLASSYLMPPARIFHALSGLFGRAAVAGPAVSAQEMRAGQKSRLAGFTLFELLTVITILLILFGITLGAISGAKERTNIARARSELAALTNALEEFKRFYGDYPQLGALTHASATPANAAAGPGLNLAEAMFFNCLTGVYGPVPSGRGQTWVPLNGPNFLPSELLDAIAANPSDPSAHKHIDGTLLVTFLVPNVPTPNSPPVKTPQNVCLLDPWGRRYRYYYKNPTNPGQWQAPSYVLYSAGTTVATSGNDTPPIAPLTGLFLPTQTAEMADNIYAIH